MQRIKTFIQRHPVVTYFGIAYIIPVLSFLVIVLPKLIRGEGMHASNTGFLVILAPLHISPAQEALWYAVYAAVLWIAVAIIVARYGKRFVQQPVEVQAV